MGAAAALAALSRLLARHLALATLGAAALAYLHPQLFLPLEGVFLWLFAATMLAIGLVLDPAEVREALHSPRAVALGVLTQYTVMPLAGLAAARLGGFGPELALGFVVVGAAPGAMASNVIVYLAGGATAFSVAMTTVATFLSPLLTPALVDWLAGAYLPVPVGRMMWTITWTVVLPLALGLALQRLPGGRALAAARAAAPGVAATAIVAICAYAVAANAGRLAAAGPAVFGAVVALNAAGYGAGWGLGRLYGFGRRRRLALAIEIGMQNAGLGVALALAHFGPASALPGALFAVWCILTAAAATAVLRRRAPPPAPA